MKRWQSDFLGLSNDFALTLLCHNNLREGARHLETDLALTR